MYTRTKERDKALEGEKEQERERGNATAREHAKERERERAQERAREIQRARERERVRAREKELQWARADQYQEEVALRAQTGHFLTVDPLKPATKESATHTKHHRCTRVLRGMPV